MTTTRTEQQLLIVFADITNFRLHAQRLDDQALADLLDAYYRFVEELALRASGQIIKFMSDEFLAIWMREQIPSGLAAIPVLKREVDAWWTGRGFDSRLIVKAHVGDAVVGTFGNESRFDVIGHAVTRTAALPAQTICLSSSAYDHLDPAARDAWQCDEGKTCYTLHLT